MNIRQLFPALLVLTLICLTAFSARAQTAGAPYMPAAPKKVLADIGAPADVQAIVSGGWGYAKTDVMIIGYPYKNGKEFFDEKSALKYCMRYIETNKKLNEKYDFLIKYNI